MWGSIQLCNLINSCTSEPVLLSVKHSREGIDKNIQGCAHDSQKYM